MPEKFKQYGRLWEYLNPGIDLHDWKENEIFGRTWINQAVIEDMVEKSRQPGADLVAFYTQIADVIDYELCYEFGGFYFNTDVKPLKPLSTLNIDERIPGFAMEDDVHAVNMAMYAPKGNQLFAEIITNLPYRYFGMPGAFMNATTGVQLIMETLSRYNDPVRLWHRNVFNPIHFTDFGYGEEPDLDRNYPEETVAVHSWGHRTNQRSQRIIES
jgi:mannosyltransferase OCH1-like enzyme